MPTTPRPTPRFQSLVNDLNKALSTPTIKTGVLTTFAPAADVTFSVVINGGLSADVTLLAADMAANTTVSDLVEDINDALSDAGLSASVTAKSSGTNSLSGNARIKFEGNTDPLNAGFVSELEITAVSGNALNLPTSAVATSFAGHLVANSMGNKLVLSVMKDNPETTSRKARSPNLQSPLMRLAQRLAWRLVPRPPTPTISKFG